MKISLKGYAITLLCCFCIIVQAMADVRLPKLVSNGMVLQRGTKIKLWGWAAPSEKVVIEFNHKKSKTITGADGKWTILFPAIKAGGPYTMDIAANNHIIIRDVLIGDVWFCSGQSNMVLPIERVKERYPEEIAKADYPEIRNFFIPTTADVTKVHDDLSGGKWIAASPENVLGFGAASYFFAKKIYLKYHIPIGLINSSVGGTPAEAWISEDGFKQLPQYQHKIDNYKDTAFINSLSRKARAVKPNTKISPDKGLTGPKPWFDTTYVPVDWHKFWLPGYWADQGVRGLSGTVWFRKEIDIPVSMTGKSAKLFLGRIVDADQAYVNGVLVGETTYQYPPRRYQVPAGLLKTGKNIITVKVVNTSGKGGFVPDKPYYLAVGEQQADLRGDWLYKVGQVFNPEDAPQGNAFSAQNEPTGLYNTMVAPAINYQVKGFLWYQGEANTSKPKEYQYLLTALINDWRNKWNQGELPFIYAQLPNFMEVQYLPAESQWAELRESQLKTLAVPHTGMAVTIDAGEWNDIHPLNKKAVGERLALAAQKEAYGDQAIVASGPVYKSYTIQGSKILLTFNSIGSGLVAGNGSELMYFAIAGRDKKYKWAKALIQGNNVVVWNDEIEDPAAVRYAWADNPEGANLYNKEGLPASPFTTDDQE